MIAIAYGFQGINAQSGFLHGLKLAAVAVVAQAVWTMAVKLCPDRERVTLALVAACVVLGSSSAWLQVVVLAAGALFGWIFLRENAGEIMPAQRGLHGSWFAWANIALYFLLLAGLPLLSALFQEHWLQLADAFYRSGALVFGGGHVVLPLLQSQTVSRGWHVYGRLRSRTSNARATVHFFWNARRRSKFRFSPAGSLVKSAEKSEGMNLGTPAAIAPSEILTRNLQAVEESLVW
jgi:chromate transport protein ChrA